MMLLGFGIGFELPVIVFYLVIFNIVPYAKLRSSWRVVYVVLMLVASAATPDWSPWTMGGLYVALVLLYEVQHAARARHAPQANRRAEARRACRGRGRLRPLTHRTRKGFTCMRWASCTGILEASFDAAEKAGAHRITEIRITVGELTEIQEFALDFAFQSMTPGTMAEGATLVVTTVAPSSRCRECGLAVRSRPVRDGLPRRVAASTSSR